MIDIKYRSMFKTILTVCCLLVLTPAWAVHKCTDANGKVSYQETPCAAGAQGRVLDMDVSKPNAPEEYDADVEAQKLKTQANLAKYAQRDAIEQAVRDRRAVVGMTLTDLSRSLGSPNLVNQAAYGSQVNNQLIFERPEGTWYVYSDGSQVTAVEFSQRIAGSAKPPCPSSLELRNMRVSANSDSASREKRRAFAALARRCGDGG